MSWPSGSVPAAVARHAAPPHRSGCDRSADAWPPAMNNASARAAAVFADATLPRVLEVIDRRRPITQLRPLLAPALIDTVVTLTRAHQTQRCGSVAPGTAAHAAFDDAEPSAAEVFATSSAT